MEFSRELVQWDARTLALQVRNRHVSPVEVVQAVITRMQHVDPLVFAFCTPVPEWALQQAHALEQRIMRGEDVGPLAGVPIGVKDLIPTQGIRTMSGSMAYKDFVPDEDDVSVERIRKADAIILGKTSASEFGYSAEGKSPVSAATRNPWNLEMTPGGSSAGSAVAVATGMGPVALGSDGGGSIRIPAAFCGIFGCKASMGRVPLYPSGRDERYPGLSSWESVEHVGPLSRTVLDAALMMSILAGPDDRDRHSLPHDGLNWTGGLSDSLKGKRVALTLNWGYLAVDPGVAAMISNAARLFESELGCIVEEDQPGWEDPADAFAALIALETDLKAMRAMAEQYEDSMSSHLLEFLRHPWTAEDLTNAIVARKAINNKMWRFMRQYDLILTPTTAVAPFDLGIEGPEIIAGRRVPPTAWQGFTFPINMTGQPAASVPVGLTTSGLPVGMQIIGRRLEDLLVLQAARLFEQVLPWQNMWPPILEKTL